MHTCILYIYIYIYIKIILHLYFGVQIVLISTWTHVCGFHLCKLQLVRLTAVLSSGEYVSLYFWIFFAFTVSDLADHGRTLSICGCFILMSLSGTTVKGG